MLFVCIAALAKLQLFAGSDYLKEISEFEQSRNKSRQFKTIRGKILDRNGKVIATDEAEFELDVNYGLTRYFDKRDLRARKLLAAKREDAAKIFGKLNDDIASKVGQLEHIIDKCVQLGGSREEILSRIEGINNTIWNLRSFQAWRRRCANSSVITKYGDIASVPLSEALQDFSASVPNEDERLLLIAKGAEIAEMKKDWSLIPLESDDDIFAAQVEFAGTDGVNVKAAASRIYPYGRSACQTVGWVGRSVGAAAEPFADDRLMRYLDGEVCGREDGVEYACEGVLRGKRGEIIYDLDGKVVGETQTDFGKDVKLTLDIELTKQVAEHLANPAFNSNSNSPMAAVVVDVNSGDIISMVSLPEYDINRIRYDYGKLRNDPCRPLVNRAINAVYPPGSVIKPLIVIAGMESGKVTSGEVISCAAGRPEKGWPACWIQKQGSCHDDKWANNARNALKGSCNVYLSLLANRLDTRLLQQYLYDFGYGREAVKVSDAVEQSGLSRNLRQAEGVISSGAAGGEVKDFNEIAVLDDGEKRWFGIGQGNLRVTPLQVADSMATIARGGIFLQPKLFADGISEPRDLRISSASLNVVRDGMWAVVNEAEGTAYNEFRSSDFGSNGVKVYGKTGSTERPFHAWFAGFAEDRRGRKLAFAVIVEGGAHGASDAAPLARDMLKFCMDAGYIGDETAAK